MHDLDKICDAILHYRLILNRENPTFPLFLNEEQVISLAKFLKIQQPQEFIEREFTQIIYRGITFIIIKI